MAPPWLLPLSSMYAAFCLDSVTVGGDMLEPRDLTDEEIEQVFLGSDDPTVRDLFLFVKQHTFDGQFQSGAAKAQATFNFYMRVRLVSGTVGPRVALEYRAGESKVRLYLNWERKYLVPESALTAYREDLGELFGGSVYLSVPEPGVPLTALRDSLDAFERVFLKFRDAIESAAG